MASTLAHIGKDALTAERRMRAFELRKAKLSYTRIGDQLGVSVATAHSDVKTIINALNEQTLETAEEIRQLELQSLDELEATLIAQFKAAHAAQYQTIEVTENGQRVTKPVLCKIQSAQIVQRAVDRILKIKQRRAKLIGLDAPTQHVVQIEDARQAITNYNQLVVQVIAKFVPDDLRPQLAGEMTKVLHSSAKKMKAIDAADLVEAEVPVNGE